MSSHRKLPREVLVEDLELGVLAQEVERGDGGDEVVGRFACLVAGGAAGAGLFGAETDELDSALRDRGLEEYLEAIVSIR